MFDPYHKWLGIPKKYRPPTFYRLLGIEPDETDRDVIEEAAIRQSAHLRTYQIGEHADLCTRLLNEISQARTVLLDPAKRKKYDAHLAQRARANQSAGIQTPATGPSAQGPAALSPFSDLDSGPAQSKTNLVRAQADRHRKKRPNYLFLGLAAGVALLVLFVAVPVGVVALFLMRSTSSNTPPDTRQNNPIAFVKKEDKLKKKPDVVVKPKNKPIENPNPVNPKTKPVDPKPNPVQPKPKPKGNDAPGTKIDPKHAIDQNPNDNSLEAEEIFDISTGGRDNAVDVQFVPETGAILIASAGLQKFDRATKKMLKEYEIPNSNGPMAHTFLQLTPDGKHLFSVHKGEKTIHIWETGTDQEIGRLDGHNSGIKGIALTPDGKQLISIGDQTLRVWDVKNRKEVFRTPITRNSSNWGLALSPDGRIALVAKRIINIPRIEVWDIENRKLARRMNLPNGWSLGSIAVAANGAYAGTLSSAKAPQFGIFFGQITGDKVNYVPAKHPLKSVDISPDGRYAVACGYHQNFYAWDAKTFKQVCQFTGHKGFVSRVRFAANGTQIHSCGGAGNVKIWKMAKREVAAIPDPKGGPAAKRYELGRSLVTARLLPMSDTLLLGGTKVQLWKPGAEPFELAPNKSGGVHAAVSVSPDGSMAATSVMGERDISLWDLRKRKRTGILVGHTDRANCLVFLADGKRLISGGFDKKVRLWDVVNRKQLYIFNGPTNRLEGLAVSADGSRLAAATSDGTIYLWDLPRRLPIRSIKINKNAFPKALVFSPSGKRIISGGCAGIFLLETDTLRILYRIPVANRAFVYSFSISSDGKRGVSTCSGNDARVWNMQDMKLLHTLSHAETVTGAIFASDNRTIYTSARDSMYVWRMP